MGGRASPKTVNNSSLTRLYKFSKFFPIVLIMNVNYFNFLLATTTLLFCCSSCFPHDIDVQTQYLSHENLASYHIGTPDPHLDNTAIGQRLLIQWSLSSEQMEDSNDLSTIFLYLTVRFRNHQEQEIKIPIYEKRGYYLYNLTNEDYCKFGGILTYKVEIQKNECIIASWKHPLWVKLITLDL